jgi:hypothetical protein
MEDEQQTSPDALPDPFYVYFRIGDAFTPGDPLSEWIVALSIAANDLSVLSGWLRHDDPDAGRYTYIIRVWVAHFYELGEGLSRRRDIPAIAEFVDAMGDDAAGYHAALETHSRLRPRLREIRSLTAFHYPRPVGGRSPLTVALRDAADSGAVVCVSDDPGVARFGFAEEIVAALFTRRAGGDAEMGELMNDVTKAVIGFIDFVTMAASRFVGPSGAPITRVIPADDPEVGWIPVQADE